MTTLMILRLIGLLFFLIAADVLSWLFLRGFIRSYRRPSIWFTRIWWVISFGFIGSYIIALLVNGSPGHDYTVMRTYFLFFGLFLLIYLPKAIIATFYLLNNILTLVFKIGMWGTRKLTLVIGWISIAAALLMFLSVGNGILFGKTRFTVKEIELTHPMLPVSFDGFRILQFSDTHFGSFGDEQAAIRGLGLIAGQEADVVAFTGDLVNMVAEEAEPYRAAMKSISAPYGKFAVLGNHDLDDYRKWDTASLKQADIEKLVAYHEETGSVVLRNTNRPIVKGHDTLYIAGVDNWGLPPFHQHGDLDDAIAGLSDQSFIILLSHDPSHWDAEIRPSTNIALTLSGHTHGMQFALSLGKKKWSPISRMYKRWYGLFHEEGQYLYVNPGFGYIGFNGRVGMPPEITIITLRSVSTEK